MSLQKAKHEAQRWLTTALEDLDAARSLTRSHHFAHACFLAQQAAEKAVKAVWYAVDEEPWGHSVQKLVAEMPRPAGVDIAGMEEAGALLDRYYITTRYPNGLPDLTPGQTFFLADAEKAIATAATIVECCRQSL